MNASLVPWRESGWPDAVQAVAPPLPLLLWALGRPRETRSSFQIMGCEVLSCKIDDNNFSPTELALMQLDACRIERSQVVVIRGTRAAATVETVRDPTRRRLHSALTSGSRCRDDRSSTPNNNTGCNESPASSTYPCASLATGHKQPGKRRVLFRGKKFCQERL